MKVRASVKPMCEKCKVVKRKVPRTLDPLNPESGRRIVERFFNPFMEKVPEHLE